MTNYCPACGVKNRSNAKYCVDCGCPLLETTSTGSLASGTVIDNRYEIKKLIKSGGMGAIYQAIDKRFNNKCAVKEMVMEHVKEDAAYLTMRFQEEAQLLRSLNHRNLPRVIDYFIEHGAYYLIMDLVDGIDLEELQERCGQPWLPEEEIVQWSIELLEVLSYLHNQSPPIIYRDMKPSNVMIRNDNGRVMLVDFGIARSIVPDRRSTMTTIGTPHYASPEHFEGRHVIQSDIFSLGATIHHLLTGKVPSPCLFKPVRELNPAVSPDLELIVMKALNLDIEDRFQSAEEMKSYLLQYRRNEKIIIDGSTANRNIKKSNSLSKKTLVKKQDKIISPVLTRIEKNLPGMIKNILKREVEKAIVEETYEKSESYKGIEILENYREEKKASEQGIEYRVKDPGFSPAKELPRTIVNSKDNSELLLVPGGVYHIGNDDDNPYAVGIEKPRHRVNLKSFYIDRYQVTNKHYCRFLNRKRMEGREEIWIYIDDRECKIERVKGRYRVKTGYNDHPVVCVTWYGARAYAEWAEKRLPLEAEWEVAARGPERREYPWGNDWSPDKCSNNCNGQGTLMPVGTFSQGASYFGVEDMAGNVWEWCYDWLNAYPGNTYKSENFGNKFKVVRGGAWFLDNPGHLRSSFRRWYVPDFRNYFLGFRCCKNT